VFYPLLAVGRTGEFGRTRRYYKVQKQAQLITVCSRTALVESDLSNVESSDRAKPSVQIVVTLYIRGRLAAAQSNAALGEKLLSFAGEFVFCGRLLVSRHDKSLSNKLIKNLPFIRLQIRTVSFQYIAKNRNFLVSDDGLRHYAAPKATQIQHALPLDTCQPTKAEAAAGVTADDPTTEDNL